MLYLLEVMNRTDGWGYCWWREPHDSHIIDAAHRLGLVYRGSVTQVHWTDKGIALFRKYVR